MGDEFSDPIEQFKKPSNPSLLGSQFGGVDPRSPGMQVQNGEQKQMPPQMQPQQHQHPQQLTQEQFKAQQQQQFMQQQQFLRQQAMAQMQQQQQQQQNSNKSQQETFLNIKEKFSNMNFSGMLQELLILSVLFIVYNTEFVKSLISKVPGINMTSSGNYDTLGTILSAVLFSLAFIFIRLII